MFRSQLVLELTRAVHRARESNALPAGEIPALQLDVPPSPDVGDFSSDAALCLARSGDSPARIAEVLSTHLVLPEWVESVEATGAGFLNFRLRPGWLVEAVQTARRADGEFGRSQPACPTRILIEFVSAHPTGALTVAHGRGAALGDSIANLLDWTGHQVAREYYVNDVGVHIDRFARSLEVRYLQALGRPAHMPPDSYRDDYTAGLGRQLAAERGASLADLPVDERRTALRSAGLDAVLADQAATLTRLGVRFDQWFRESSLTDGRLGHTLNSLRDSAAAYDLDAALWLRARNFGDHEDRPLLRSNGRPSYLAGDLSYHQDKLARGFDHLIDIWGAEHQEHTVRTRAGLGALGVPANRLEILIFQPPTLRIDGTVVEAGAGNTMTLGEVIEQTGSAAARCFYLSRPTGAPLEFDLDLARRTTADNPAVALRQALQRAEADANPGAPLTDPTGAVRDLLREVADLPEEIRTAAREREPYRLIRYAGNLATAYTEIGDLGSQQGAVADAVRVALGNAMAVLGV